ncbi:purine-nucleoside phosphorylase [Pullulanibacillus sp. KACC 23026]|uniref:purine-nucleoside phosphorylase n=1 Tax=Pullulanibacillus sp. KACC 23026 TaxID=3028315 RepID=UPI0023B17E98|nr:purine-nucleoside phosphorylase [Pullulanibacillus sp. KACC 23026]WEG12042.1 purine-nucleoside phosphorylase [Pullulanibacillus sp. KACC 23026]
MSVHIAAKQGEIADKILLPGDPLRAKYIAETFLENATCYNEVRGMYGFTGTYKGERISVQGTGMGVPSISIYTHELMADYGVKSLIRVGSCGAYLEEVKVRDVILAMSSSTDSQINKLHFQGIDFAPTANFELLKAAYDVTIEKNLPVHVGSIFTSDIFYNDNQEQTELLRKHGTLAVEMETAALYTLAARFKAKALSILTVSDHLITGEATTSEERQTTFNQMIEIALDAAIRS